MSAPAITTVLQHRGSDVQRTGGAQHRLCAEGALASSSPRTAPAIHGHVSCAWPEIIHPPPQAVMALQDGFGNPPAKTLNVPLAPAVH